MDDSFTCYVIMAITIYWQFVKGQMDSFFPIDTPMSIKVYNVRGLGRGGVYFVKELGGGAVHSLLCSIEK